MGNNKRLIAVAGGIGSGKSVVCNVLRAMGYVVYDCDSRARVLMDNDKIMIARIAEEVSGEAVDAAGRIDRRRLADIVFNNPQALERLNGIVHGAVRDDFRRWSISRRGDRLFVETAILYQSGLDRDVDEVWEIDAPLDVRIERVMARNGLTREQVLARIAAQDSFEPELIHGNVIQVVNDGCEPLLPQIERLLAKGY